MKILLHFHHGLGDAVQFGVVLRHFQKYRPDLVIDVASDLGKESIFYGLCNRSYLEGEVIDESQYQLVHRVTFADNRRKDGDRPNSKVTQCLFSEVTMDYDPSIGRYHMVVASDNPVWIRAEKYYRSIGARKKKGKFNVFIIHYEGHSWKEKKNLRIDVAQTLCERVLEAGYIPVVFDWDKPSPLATPGTKIYQVGMNVDYLWPRGVGEADQIYALIQLATAYIGIDSGPGKIASATDTPTWIYWRDHSPNQFHDPAENTTHMIPEGRTTWPHVHKHVWDYMVKHYKIIEYANFEKRMLDELDRFFRLNNAKKRSFDEQV